MGQLGRAFPESHRNLVGAPEAAEASPPGGGGPMGTGRAAFLTISGGSWEVQPLPNYPQRGLTGSWVAAGVYVISGGSWT